MEEAGAVMKVTQKSRDLRLNISDQIFQSRIRIVNQGVFISPLRRDYPTPLGLATDVRN